MLVFEWARRSGPLHIVAQEVAAQDVQIGVGLALHRIAAELGEEPEAARAVFLAHLDGDPANGREFSPHLLLAHVLLRYSSIITGTHRRMSKMTMT